MSETMYPLPRGGITKSERRFKREWAQMRNAIESVFGGYVIGHGPGVLIGHEDRNVRETVDLPQWALNALLDYVDSVDDQ
jgi:hypothetical protein